MNEKPPLHRLFTHTKASLTMRQYVGLTIVIVTIIVATITIIKKFNAAGL